MTLHTHSSSAVVPGSVNQGGAACPSSNPSTGSALHTSALGLTEGHSIRRLSGSGASSLYGLRLGGRANALGRFPSHVRVMCTHDARGDIRQGFPRHQATLRASDAAE